MKELYSQMISALTSAVANVNNVPTPEELTNNFLLFSGNGPSASLMFKALAMVDIVTGINHLNQFLDENQETLPSEDGALRKNIIAGAMKLTSDQEQNVSKLNHIVGNMGGVRMDGTRINLQSVVKGILEEITRASLLLSK